MARGKHRKRKARRRKSHRKAFMWLLFFTAILAGTGTIAMAMRGIEVNVKMEP